MAVTASSARNSSGTILLLLSAIVLWSLALRLWMMWPQPAGGRWWDERYGARNVVAFLDQPSYKPANGYYPTLSWLPHALVLWLSEDIHQRTGVGAFKIRSAKGLTPTGYRLSRGIQVLCGTACLLVIFRIGRRLAGPRLGVLAAFLVATDAYHIRLSAEAKPDSLLWLLLLIAFDLSLAAIASPSLAGYVAAGIAIGLAPSAKWNAAPIAIPITLATLAGFARTRDRRTLLWLCAAGLAALMVFLMLQPYLILDRHMYQRDFGETLRVYEQKANRLGVSSHFAVAAKFFSTTIESTRLGPIAGSLGLFGLFIVGWRGVRAAVQRRSQPIVDGWLMSFTLVVAYVTIYSATTLLPVPHNWIALAPFVALASAGTMLQIWDRLVARAPRLARPAVAATLATVAAVALSWNVNKYVYEELVPTTETLAASWLKASPIGDRSGRLVFTEATLDWPGRRSHDQTAPALVVVDRLDQVSKQDLDSADAEVFYSKRMEQDDGGSYRARKVSLYQANRDSTPPPGWQVFAPLPFRSRGEALVVFAHPHEPAGPEISGEWICQPAPLPGAGVSCTTEALAGIAPGESLSLSFPVPRSESTAILRIGGAQLQPLPWRRVDRTSVLRLSPRFLAGSDAPVLELRTASPPEQINRIPLTVWRWRTAPGAP